MKKFFITGLAAVLLLAATLAAPGPVAAGDSVQRIAIDPGHGGADQGVVGPAGLTESELSLLLALDIKRALENEFGAAVFLTRKEKGKNPALHERTALANRVKADLLLSIHAGGGEGAGPGFAVFYQDYSRQAELAAMVPTEDEPRLWELSQAAHLTSSRRLAEELDLALSEVLHFQGTGHRGLPLALLAGANMPAVLVEAGNLTNPEEERRLETQGYRDALTRGIMRGIRAWWLWLEEKRSP